jgi:ABC-type glycerol-3-phosphate transport system substrate-binding protein
VALALTLALIAALLPGCASPTTPDAAASGDEAIADAFEEGSSDIQVTGEGEVTRVLDDDDDGDRHQRFILALASGQTLLIAHNIHIAPRIEALHVGDTVAFAGEYEWNEEGGVVHWTHHDPDGEHAPGWLEHEGDRYE